MLRTTKHARSSSDPVHIERMLRHPRLFPSLAANPHLSEEAQYVLALSDPVTRRILARNASLCLAVQEMLTVNQPHQITHTLAQNPCLHPDIQESILHIGDALLVQSMVSNPSLSRDAQRCILQDSHPTIAALLATQTHLDPSFHLVLASSPDPFIQKALSTNPSLRLSEDYPLSFCQDYFPDFLLDLLVANRLDRDWSALALDWTGSVAEFLQALLLLALPA